MSRNRRAVLSDWFHVTKPELGSVQVPVAPTEEAKSIAASIDAATFDWIAQSGS